MLTNPNAGMNGKLFTVCRGSIVVKTNPVLNLQPFLNKNIKFALVLLKSKNGFNFLLQMDDFNNSTKAGLTCVSLSAL
jgi:hypothetical protein